MKIHLRDVNFSYGSTPVLRNLSWEASGPGLYRITGSNGSGKSTLLTIIAGLTEADSGTVSIEGTVSYVMQDVALSARLTVRDNLLLRAEALGIDAQSQTGAPEQGALGITDILDQMVSRLSGGQRRKAALALAQLSSPDIYLFDEASSGLDTQSRAELVRMARELSTRHLVILVDHTLANEPVDGTLEMKAVNAS